MPWRRGAGPGFVGGGVWAGWPAGQASRRTGRELRPQPSNSFLMPSCLLGVAPRPPPAALRLLLRRRMGPPPSPSPPALSSSASIAHRRLRSSGSSSTRWRQRRLRRSTTSSFSPPPPTSTCSTTPRVPPRRRSHSHGPHLPRPRHRVSLPPSTAFGPQGSSPSMDPDSRAGTGLLDGCASFGSCWR